MSKSILEAAFNAGAEWKAGEGPPFESWYVRDYLPFTRDDSADKPGPAPLGCVHEFVPTINGPPKCWRCGVVRLVRRI